MSETKHTPGPWAIAPGDPCVIYSPDNPEDEPCLAITYDVESADRFHWLRDADQAEANARLIAAAPDLLTVAMRAEYIISQLDGDGWCVIREDILKALRAAIGKVEERAQVTA